MPENMRRQNAIEYKDVIRGATRAKQGCKQDVIKVYQRYGKTQEYNKERNRNASNIVTNMYQRGNKSATRI